MRDEDLLAVERPSRSRQFVPQGKRACQFRPAISGISAGARVIPPEAKGEGPTMTALWVAGISAAGWGPPGTRTVACIASSV